MKEEYSVIEKFEIAGRGTVVVIDEITERMTGVPYRVEVTGANGQLLSAEAFKDWLLRRHPEPIEKEAYTLKGIPKQDIAENAVISFL